MPGKEVLILNILDDLFYDNRQVQVEQLFRCQDQSGGLISWRQVYLVHEVVSVLCGELTTVGSIVDDGKSAANGWNKTT